MPETELKSPLIEEFPESIELVRNSKGVGWTIKLRAREGREDTLLDRVIKIDDRLKAQYRDQISC